MDSTAGDETPEEEPLPAVAGLPWYDHAEAAATARFSTVARRRPAGRRPG